MVNLRKLAKAYGLRQRELAEILKTDQSVVSLIVNGHRRLTEDQYEALVARFGADELAKYEGDDVVRQKVDLTLYDAEMVQDVRHEVAEEVEIKETIILGADAINKVGVDLRKELTKSPEDMALEVEVKPSQVVLPPHEVKIYTENDEMASDIEPNDPVFVQIIPSPKVFKPRHMYLVNLEYGSVVRWVVPEGEDHIRLVSRKGSDVVPISSVKAMFEVVAITKRPKTLPIDLTTESQRMERKESQLNTLLEQQGRLIGIIEKHTK